jgi:hypothetical protein
LKPNRRRLHLFAHVWWYYSINFHPLFLPLKSIINVDIIISR